MNQRSSTVSRTDATRASILETAESLFAENGVNGVTINTINQAAGQKNSNAVRYHFGGKNGLLQSILDKHLARISTRRSVMLEELVRRDNHNLRDLVEALVLPIAQQMDDPDGGEAFIHINAELMAVKAFSFYEEIEHPLRLVYEDQLVLLFRAHLSQLPQLLVKKRMILISGLIYNGLSDHARMRHQLDADNPLVDSELSVCTLVDAIVAVLAGPVSTVASTSLERLKGH